MKSKYIPMLFMLLVWNCKQKTDAVPIPVEKEIDQIGLSNAPDTDFKALLKFLEIDFADSTDINSIIDFKEIDQSGGIETITLDKGIAIYKEIVKGQAPKMSPIFEIKNTNNTLLMLNGKGFGGPIWATILIDKKSLEILKIQFDHRSETEGYGAAMTQPTFENMFSGTKIEFHPNTFGLQKGSNQLLKGSKMVDGISGATITSMAVVEMVNQGLLMYHDYLSL